METEQQYNMEAQALQEIAKASFTSRPMQEQSEEKREKKPAGDKPEKQNADDKKEYRTTEKPQRKKVAVPLAKKRKEKKDKTVISEFSQQASEISSAKHKKSAAAKIVNAITHAFSHVVKISFMLRFHTQHGQNLFITGNHEIFGNDDASKALPMQYFNEEYWTATIELHTDTIPAHGVVYNYLLKNEDRSLIYDWGNDKKLEKEILHREFAVILDSWNHSGYFQNVFYTEPFQNVLLKKNFKPGKADTKNYTHVFRVKAPLLKRGETICLLGNEKELGAWSETKVKLLNKKEGEDFFSLHINLSKVTFPLIYKYGVYNVNEKKFMRYEEGNNRFLFDTFAKNKTSIINDGFALLPSDNWKAAGVAIPVFSLRSNSSCGVGEFADLKLLVDWAKKTGLQLIQILPVNATTAMKTWADSYPYAAISAFALHPMYLNLNELVQTEYKYLLDEIAEEKEALNNLTDVDYIKVNELKWRIIKKLYPLQKEKTFSSDEYKSFFEQNKTWLIPYAVFCFFRDKYGTADFNEWPVHKNYNEVEAKNLWNDEGKNTALSIYFFVQYHLHHQLKQAVQYAHENGVILKGDIPIGIYRYGADAWQHPELYHINMQAGAPPDDFAVKGQNWGFPTYNWEKMKENHFAWWKHRFEQMSNYFDAFRIDHILGFFRIWNIPTEQVEGIMGYFTPALTVHINEFNENGIWFDYHRYCKPFITEHILWDVFRENIKYAKDTFLEINTQGQFQLKPKFSEQHKVKEYFEGLEQNEQNQKLQQGLFDLISNVILFEAEDSQGQQFHFRFAMENTSSFQTLEHNTQNQLRDLYVNYFFQRQDWCWQQQAMQKLPSLKRASNMLICGEDLGLVPECVPEVMKELGILSLEIQRMPKDSKQEFFHPNNAPYLSVVTPSTHDMSTIRGWWEEDHSKTERFFHQQLVQWGKAPYYCEDWINKAIVLQHLYSPAMWSIFLLQDLLGMNAKIRRENPHEERINLPSNPNNQWKYRMHISLEDLLNADEFNRELRHNIQACGRC